MNDAFGCHLRIGTRRAVQVASLKQLSAEELGLSIQDGEHSPVDDARAALYLYLKHRQGGEQGVMRMMPGLIVQELWGLR